MIKGEAPIQRTPPPDLGTTWNYHESFATRRRIDRDRNEYRRLTGCSDYARPLWFSRKQADPLRGRPNERLRVRARGHTDCVPFASDIESLLYSGDVFRDEDCASTCQGDAEGKNRSKQGRPQGKLEGISHGPPPLKAACP